MIAIINYEMGNLKSVSKAFNFIGAKVKITSCPDDIIQAKAVILPGVGAFYRGMENLKKLKLDKAIYTAIEQNKPFLGICLGLQLLFTQTEEHGIHQGLNIIKGNVKKLPSTVKIPHMGWNQIKHQQSNKIFTNIPNDSYVYFVHSFYVEPEDKSIISTTTNYGLEFASSINKANIFAFQFHPEKSEMLGLKILRNFYEYVS
ncbi:MAG: imidazole glycerol phosphate synthase subunit HisH [bacterium]